MSLCESIRIFFIALGINIYFYIAFPIIKLYNRIKRRTKESIQKIKNEVKKYINEILAIVILLMIIYLLLRLQNH